MGISHHLPPSQIYTGQSRLSPHPSNADNNGAADNDADDDAADDAADNNADINADNNNAMHTTDDDADAMQHR